MKNLLKPALVVLALLVHPLCQADGEKDFARVTCVPESSYLRVEHVSVDAASVFAGADRDKDRKKRLKAWKKSGYLDPSQLRSKCKIGGSTFELATSQGGPQAWCGDRQPIYATLLRDKKPLLRAVVLGGECHEAGPYLTAFEVVAAAGDKSQVKVCAAGASGRTAGSGDAPKCKSLAAWDLLRDGPITSDTLQQFVDER